jgi:hypothetical protein
MTPFTISPHWERYLLDKLSDLKVEKVFVDLLPMSMFDVQFLACVHDEKGRRWQARMVLDENDPLLRDLDGIVAKLREIITDPKYKKK